MKKHSKTLFGSIVAFFVGTSCCWLSSLVVWVGGVSFMGMLVTLLEDLQIVLIGLGVVLLVLAIYQYSKNREKKTVINND